MRKVVSHAGLTWDAKAPFEPAKTLGEAVLVPTRLYVKSCLAATRETKAVKALAHITGGGFPDNIPRVLPKGFGARIDLANVPALPVFRWMAQAGNIAQDEMLRTFNCGIGMIAVASAREADAVSSVLSREGEHVIRLGEIFVSATDEAQVRFDGRLDLGVG